MKAEIEFGTPRLSADFCSDARIVNYRFARQPGRLHHLADCVVSTELLDASINEVTEKKLNLSGSFRRPCNRGDPGFLRNFLKLAEGKNTPAPHPQPSA